MNRQIWKYTLEVSGLQRLILPKGSQILFVREQHGKPRLWALVDPKHEPVDGDMKDIETFGTGHVMDDAPRKYLGSYYLDNGSLVYHVFEKLPA